jgi:2TM domain
MAIDESSRQDVLRERAIKRLKKRRDFSGHLLVYVLVNAFFVVIWAMTTDAHGFFWPVFPIVGWGIGVVLNAWDVYRNDEFDEEQIRREIERLQAHAAGIRASREHGRKRLAPYGGELSLGGTGPRSRASRQRHDRRIEP